jgi:hypothetical protein
MVNGQKENRKASDERNLLPHPQLLKKTEQPKVDHLASRTWVLQHLHFKQSDTINKHSNTFASCSIIQNNKYAYSMIVHNQDIIR